jgi:tetratricopeptide (TPR) repeat protein
LILLQKILQKNPEDAYLLYQTGITLKSLSKNVEAVGFLLQALKHMRELTPEILEQIHMKLAQIYLGLQDDENALKHAEDCLKINPVNVLALYTAGLALFTIGKPQDAYYYFEKLSTLPELRSQNQQEILQAMSLIRSNFM